MTMRACLMIAFLGCSSDRDTVSLDRVRALTEQVCACTDATCRDRTRTLLITHTAEYATRDLRPDSLARMDKQMERFMACANRWPATPWPGTTP